MSDRPTTALGVLAALQSHLTRGVREAGFVLADASPPGEAPKADIGFLEYRADLDGRRLLLDFYEDPTGRTVVAELWNPAHLRSAGPELTADEIAERRLTWHRAPDTSPEVLVGTIATEVLAWLTLRTRSRDPLTSTAWGGQPPTTGEVGVLRRRLARQLENLQRRLATYHSFDDPAAAATTDRIAAVALAIEELDAIVREAPARTG